MDAFIEIQFLEILKKIFGTTIYARKSGENGNLLV
jgi:hypothetical protein